MHIKVYIFSLLAIISSIQPIVTQTVDNKNLLIQDVQVLLSNIQRSVRTFLSSILVNTILHNVDVIFVTANLNVSTILNKNYNCDFTYLTSINLIKK
jgi:hypothetical protein